MLALSEKGDNANVDMLVADIYGQDYGRLGLKSTVIASSFGKVFKKGTEKRVFKPEDISRSLLYGVSNNIGQIACVSSIFFNHWQQINEWMLQIHECGEIRFRSNILWWLLHPRSVPELPSEPELTDVSLAADAGHAATISTLSYAIRFWSKGTKKAMFLRHEGFLWVIFLSIFRVFLPMIFVPYSAVLSVLGLRI